MSTKLFVGNLSFNTTENDLQDLFAAYGPVQQVEMIMDRMTGRPRGVGFVTMENNDYAKKAIEALHGKPFGGRDLTVNEARPREERPGGRKQLGGKRRIDAVIDDREEAMLATRGVDGPRHASHVPAGAQRGDADRRNHGRMLPGLENPRSTSDLRRRQYRRRSVAW